MIVKGGERNGPPPTTRSDDDDDACLAGARSPVSGGLLTLCDPIRQVTLRSSEMGFSEVKRPLTKKNKQKTELL